MVQRHAHRLIRQRVRPAGARHVRQPGAQPAAEGPGFWQADASLFKRFWSGRASRLEVRIEAVNIFNHVNLGNPDSEIGVPGNDNPNAGRITDTAGNYTPRNFQFGFRFIF